MVAATTTARDAGGFDVTTAAGAVAIDDVAEAGSTAGRGPGAGAALTVEDAPDVIGAGAVNVPTSTGPAWTGDVELRLFDSPTEELSRLTVDEMIGGYYRQVGVVWNGGRSLATLTPRGAVAEATR